MRAGAEAMMGCDAAQERIRQMEESAATQGCAPDSGRLNNPVTQVLVSAADPPADALIAEVQQFIDNYVRECAELDCSDEAIFTVQRARDRLAQQRDEAQEQARQNVVAGMEEAAQLFDGFTFGPYKHPSHIIREAISARAAQGDSAAGGEHGWSCNLVATRGSDVSQPPTICSNPHHWQTATMSAPSVGSLWYRKTGNVLHRMLTLPDADGYATFTRAEDAAERIHHMREMYPAARAGKE